METIKKQLKPSSLKQRSRYLLWALVVGFYLTITSCAFGQMQLGCNYKAGTFTMTLEGHTTGVGFTSRLVLTDSSGVIKYVTQSNSMTFQNVVAGNYLAYGITYENAVYVPNLTVGKNIKLVSACYKTVVVPTKVCDCNSSDGNLVSTIYSPSSGEEVRYVLTDGKGTILLIKTEPVFSGNPEGVYNIVPLTYKVGTFPLNFEIGKNIFFVTGENVLIQKSTGFIVCVPQIPILSITKTAPAAAFTGESFNYTLNIKNTGNIATNGVVTVMDTLSQGLSFQATGLATSPNWACQSSIIIINNSTRTLVNCQSTDSISPNTTQNITFTVVAQRTGTFTNQAFGAGGGSIGKIASNKVETIVKDRADCKEICVPVVISKKKLKK